MEAVVAKGLVKSIGVTNFSIQKLENLLKTAKIIPAINQSMFIVICRYDSTDGERSLVTVACYIWLRPETR